MDLSEKIKLILAHKNLSPSIFADEIGIQRSSMSHILAGRNKPSLDIVQKIIRKYPELGMKWILDGENLDFQNQETPVAMQPSMTPPAVQADEMTSKRSAIQAFEAVQQIKPRSVDKIIIFYSDGTFQELNA